MGRCARSSRGRASAGRPRRYVAPSSERLSSAATGSCASYLWPRHAYMKKEIPTAGCARMGRSNIA